MMKAKKSFKSEKTHQFFTLVTNFDKWLKIIIFKKKILRNTKRFPLIWYLLLMIFYYHEGNFDNSNQEK